MSATEDYKRARMLLRHLNEQSNKATMEARHRIAAHSIREQLQMHCVELEKEFGKQIPDQSDIDFALGSDKGWDRE
jgi:hypothetical protein